MTEEDEVRMPAAACDQVLVGLRRKLAELESWADGPIKDVGRDAVREEMARVGRNMVEHEWRWVRGR